MLFSNFETFRFRFTPTDRPLYQFFLYYNNESWMTTTTISAVTLITLVHASAAACWISIFHDCPFTLAPIHPPLPPPPQHPATTEDGERSPPFLRRSRKTACILYVCTTILQSCVEQLYNILLGKQSIIKLRGNAAAARDPGERRVSFCFRQQSSRTILKYIYTRTYTHAQALLCMVCVSVGGLGEWVGNIVGNFPRTRAYNNNM